MKVNLKKIITSGLAKPQNSEEIQGRKHSFGKLAFIIIILAGVLIYFGYGYNFHYKGEVEALIVPNIAEISGKIVESDIALGQTIKKGDLIARFDSTDLSYMLTQSELSLQKKQLALGDATVGNGGLATNSYLSARTNYQSASAAAEKALQDYTNAQTLYAQGAISGIELESAKVKLASAESVKSTALAQLNNASSQSGESSAQIDIAILENQISQIKDTLEKYTLTAPCDGIILSQNYNVGSMVAPGYNIADIGSLEEIYVVFYIPESRLGDLQYGDDIQVKANGEAIMCTVKYIDAKSQYTPRELQTAANKGKSNFKVKLLVPRASPVKPGMDVTVLFQ